MRKTFPIIFIILILLTDFGLVSAATSTKTAVKTAKPKFSYSAWVPYWRETDGVAETTAHLDVFQNLSPFSYDVKPDGTLKDQMKIDQDPWPALLSAARSKNVKIIPTVAWSDGPTIQTILSSSTLRLAHEEVIVGLTKNQGYDGIDVDYEAKLSETKKYFSKFLTELSKKLHADQKILVCSIEPRTPSSSRFKIVPKDIAYANDFKVIGQACDQVRIMAYDQLRIDLKLNAANKGEPYAPIADPVWVKKVISQAAASIPKSKIILGVPTYGYEYALGEGDLGRTYTKVRNWNYQDAMKFAANIKVVPKRNSAQEMSFVFLAVPTSTLSSLTLPSSGVATTTRSTPETRFVSFNDAVSVENKIKMAKDLGLGGVAIYKMDGGTDPALWQYLSK